MALRMVTFLWANRPFGPTGLYRAARDRTTSGGLRWFGPFGVTIPFAVLIATSAFGQEAEPLPQGATPVDVASADPAPTSDEPLLITTTTGFLDTRTTYSAVSVGKPMVADNVPALANLTEANMQLRLQWKDRAQGQADVSYIYQGGGFFYGRDASSGERVRVAAHDVSALHPAALISELYGTLNLGSHANLTMGKKRVVWGSGIAINPTDLLNPPKDPTDPTLQRAGSWLARAEFPFDDFTVTFVGAAKVTRQFGGVPSAMVVYPDYPAAGQDSGDKLSHYALAARAYGLWRETDINLMYYFTNSYNDAFTDKSRVGLSLSHVFWNALELHVDGIAQRGSSRFYFDKLDPTVLAAGNVAALRTRLEDTDIRPKVLLGARWMPEDAGGKPLSFLLKDATFSLEYYYNGEGYSSTEFKEVGTALTLMQKATAMGVTIPAGGSLFAAPGTTDPGSPQKFAFEPLRRHYLFLSYLRPMIYDDFTASAVVILGAEDWSGQFAPSIAWSAQEWLSLTLAGFFTVPGMASQGTTVSGHSYSEYGLQPTDWRAFFSARVFY